MSISSIKIDVILPIYNASLYLDACLNSLVLQKEIHKILCYDDGSYDESFNILQKFQYNYPDKIVIVGRRKLGLVGALNKLIKYSNADFIARMDADDVSSAHRFKHFKEVLKLSSSDIFYTNYYLINSDGKFKFPFIKIAPNEKYLKKIIGHYNPICHPTVIYRKNIIEKYLYDKNYPGCEDYKLWYELLKDNVKFKKINTFSLFYRIHPKQVTKLNLSVENLKNTICQDFNIKNMNVKSLLYANCYIKIYFIKNFLRDVLHKMQ